MLEEPWLFVFINNFSFLIEYLGEVSRRKTKYHLILKNSSRILRGFITRKVLVLGSRDYPLPNIKISSKNLPKACPNQKSAQSLQYPTSKPARHFKNIYHQSSITKIRQQKSIKIPSPRGCSFLIR